MDYKKIIGRFLFLFFTFFGVRVIGNVLRQTPEETAAHLYSPTPYIAALIFAVLVSGYYIFTDSKKNKSVQD